ncbi:cation transporter [candidate division WOR-3 bacterium]|nr:cation transporter [candidate division WOR-3 bacterium]
MANPAFHLQQKAERRITVIGMVVNIMLVIGKLFAGLISNSSAIIADGLHSFSDLASDIAVLWGIRAAKQPPDYDHHYGHHRYEAITALGVGILLIGAALFIAYEALITISQRHTALRNWLPFYIALASIVLKEILYWFTRAVGKRYHNQALIANAWHHRSDAFSSIAAALGILGALIGGEKWSFLDHLTAVLLAAFLVYIGIRIVRGALHKLSDRAPDQQTLTKIHQAISAIPGVKSFHAFRARSAGSGNKIEMDVHVLVDPNITVQAGHEIATQVEEQIKIANPDVTSIVIHIEPEQEDEAT